MFAVSCLSTVMNPETPARTPEKAPLLRRIITWLHERNSRPQAVSQTVRSDYIGIVANYAEPAVYLRTYEYLRAAGIDTIVYCGPLSTLARPRELWNLISSNRVVWVYGRAEGPRFVPEVGQLLSGLPLFEHQHVEMRYFVEAPGCNELIRFGELQWPPPGRHRKEAIRAVARKAKARIVVIGSGLDFEHWRWDPYSEDWELARQLTPTYSRAGTWTLPLEEHLRHVLVIPTSEGVCCAAVSATESWLKMSVLKAE